MGQEKLTHDRSVAEELHPRSVEPYQANTQKSSFRTLRFVGQSHQPDVDSYELKVKRGLGQLIGQSPVFVSAISKIPTMARCDATVLISGETGTGKEVCARAIHYLSPRATKPFIAVNCGALPAELIENELFGHERGAYTDAGSSHHGVITEAEGGTLFLDEIDCLPLLAQVKLLRFLQEKEFRPLGSSKTVKASVRVIVATNIKLEEALREEKLRRDLYYRINILSLVLPPLRERSGDIILLAKHFLEKYASEFAKPVLDLSPEVLRMLGAYSWPGNVRELEHAIERAVALSDHVILNVEDVPFSSVPPQTHHESFQIAKERVIAQFEKDYLTEILLAHQGNITKAAQAAGKNRRAFWQLLRKHEIATDNMKAAHVSDQDKR